MRKGASNNILPKQVTRLRAVDAQQIGEVLGVWNLFQITGVKSVSHSDGASTHGEMNLQASHFKQPSLHVESRVFWISKPTCRCDLCKRLQR